MTVRQTEARPSDSLNLKPDEMDWSAYAEHYDEMCELNPAYQANIQHLKGRLMSWALPETAHICDLGAGTGNYIAAMHSLLPEAHFVHVDFDANMNRHAQRKYGLHGIGNVEIVQQPVQQVSFPKHSFDLVTCVNALYAISPQEQVLRKVRDWIRPSGKLFVIDFGRKQRTIDWTLYIFRESLKAQTLGRYAKALLEAREVLKQNRRSTKGQNSGRYWLHSTRQFKETLEDCGYIVEEAFPCYRGYADLAVCSLKSTHRET